MKHTMVTFRLHRIGVVWIVVGCLLLAVLIFAAGYLAGTRRGIAITTARLKKPAVPKIAPPKVAVPKLPVNVPPVPVAPAAVAAAKSEETSVALRVGVFPSEEEAKASVQQLTALGLKPTIVPVPRAEATPLYTVRVGRYASRSDAVAAARALEKQHGLVSAVVPAE